MVRYHRMRGDDTLWLPGVDHSGIGAQFVLDKIIAADGESRASLGRERYLERMWQFMNETRPIIRGQLRRFGASLDWSRERFTMDEGSARAVRVAFKRLWDAGLVYRGEALVNWCPRCLTTISDLENVHREETGTLWTIRYHLERDDGTPDPDAWISVATTRPETLLGDTAVAVHPDDERYRRPRRPPRDPAVPRASASDRRRRARRAHVRHRRGQDHAGPRRGRLRARQAPRAAGDQRPRRRGADQQRRRRLLRARPLRGARGDPGPAPRDGRSRGRASASDGGRPLRAMRNGHRAAPVGAVVHPRQAAGRARARIGPGRPDEDPAVPLREGVRPLDGEHPRLGGRPPAVVGASHPGLVLP